MMSSGGARELLFINAARVTLGEGGAEIRPCGVSLWV